MRYSSLRQIALSSYRTADAGSPLKLYITDKGNDCYRTIAIGRRTGLNRDQFGGMAATLAGVCGDSGTNNGKAINDVELTLAKRDPATGALLPQLTHRRYSADCLVDSSCQRFDEAARNAQSAIDSKGSGYAITPNYEPQAVLGAYSYIANGLEMAIIIERSMTNIRQVAVEALIGIFDHNNRLYTGSLEAQLVHFAGIPYMRTYDFSQTCDHIRRCVRDAELGTLYRSDCVHCSRLPADAFAAKKLL